MEWTFFLLGGFVSLASIVVFPIFWGAPWHPLFPGTIRRILNFAEIKQGETLCDLGCGDGRILIAAAKEYSSKGIGVEIDPIKFGLACLLVKFKQVDEQVKIIRGNIFQFVPQDADVIYLYLTHQAMDQLFPEILKKLKPTVRIVSYRFCIRGMIPEKVSADKTLFLYQLSRGTKINNYT